ncbi:MAG: aminotransferase class V-fold PLP-dependent enzyme [Ignavibacteria bacterium]|jgi:selenocysteine lyase/cysteine desulfurase
MSKRESYFTEFRKNIIGIDQEFESPYGTKKIVYADWVASGRLYKPIEEKIINHFGPYIGNTHTETCITGTTMTQAYHEAQKIIKKHVNAGPDDVIITAGSGMTTVVNKLQRILGLKVPEQLKDFIKFKREEKPVVFISHMEHHSNHTSWLETLADVVIIEPDEYGLVNYESLEHTLGLYKDRIIKIGSFTACSNVTGIETNYHKLAKIMHRYGGICFIDFAASAPYVNINIHPEDPEEKLDAIFFSPHKFLGGPGTSGVLIFDSKLYKRSVPDHPGGGTVDWTNPWGKHKFVNNIEAREDGGTPGFLQAIKSALSIKLKEEMGVENILAREKELLKITFEEFEKIPEIHLLANESRERLGIISFYTEDIHYNLLVKLLNDKFGLQVRGGCSCAGTYGHYLLHVDPTRSKRITDKINEGDLSEKPGWVRFSLHPTMANDELYYCLNAFKEVTQNSKEWREDYIYSNKTNEYTHKNSISSIIDNKWFEISS